MLIASIVGCNAFSNLDIAFLVWITVADATVDAIVMCISVTTACVLVSNGLMVTLTPFLNCIVSACIVDVMACLVASLSVSNVDSIAALDALVSI